MLDNLWLGLYFPAGRSVSYRYGYGPHEPWPLTLQMGRIAGMFVYILYGFCGGGCAARERPGRHTVVRESVHDSLSRAGHGC